MKLEFILTRAIKVNLYASFVILSLILTVLAKTFTFNLEKMTLNEAEYPKACQKSRQGYILFGRWV